MTTKCYAMTRGSVARFTLLDSRGAPVVGPASVVATRGIAQVALSEITETQSTTLHRTDYDRPRVLLRGKTQTIGYGAEIKLINVDPDLINLLSGQDRVLNADGVAVGNEAVLKRPPVNFAMEVWSKLATPIDNYRYGYTLFPRLKGGRISGFSFGNSAVSFTVTGARTYRNSKWGYGPYDLTWNGLGWDTTPWDTSEWDAVSPSSCGGVAPPLDLGFGVGPFGEMPFGGAPIDSPRLQTPVSRNLLWRNFLVADAPAPVCGVQGLYDSIDGGSASFTTSDVIDGQNVVTSPDVVDGGVA